MFWSMGLYTATFEDVFGAPRAQINLIETCLTVATNLLSPVAGILIDRWSIRHLMMIGMAAMGLGLLVLSQAGTLFHVWAVWASLIPLGVLLIGAIPSAALVSRWFIRRRGLALGLTATGSSVGGFLIPPLMTWMFLEWDWRTDPKTPKPQDEFECVWDTFLLWIKVVLTLRFENLNLTEYATFKI